MYQRQFDDNVRFWQMQNEYNDPRNQVKRIQNAGLSPALLYGQSAGGVSGQAQSIQTPDVQTPQFRTPDLTGIGQAGLAIMNQIYDTDIKQAQVDNLKSQNAVNQQRAALTAAQTAEQLRSTKYTRQLEGISAEAAKEALRQTKVNTKFTIDENARKEAASAQSMEEAVQRIIESKARTKQMGKQGKLIEEQIKNAIKDQAIKEFEIQLNKDGFTKQDAVWWRALSVKIEMISKALGLDYILNFSR
jgi:hypothetical protein